MREARNSLFGALVVRPGLTAFLHSDEGYVSSVAFSPDGKTLAAGYRSAAAARGCGALGHGCDASGSKKKPLAVTEGYVKSVAFSPDGKTLAAGYGDDAAAAAWCSSTLI